LDWGILERSIGPRVRLLRNALQAGSLTSSEPFGLPTGSLTVMALVAANPGSSQAKLAAMAGITGPSLVGILDDLEQRKLLARTRDAVDRRRNMLALTAQGTATMNTLFSAVDPIEAPMRAALGEVDLLQLTALLDRAIAAVNQPHG
jgi:DNA-binding MarR family transcriptional regulator